MCPIIVRSSGRDTCPDDLRGRRRQCGPAGPLAGRGSGDSGVRLEPTLVPEGRNSPGQREARISRPGVSYHVNSSCANRPTHLDRALHLAGEGPCVRGVLLHVRFPQGTVKKQRVFDSSAVDCERPTWDSQPELRLMGVAQHNGGILRPNRKATIWKHWGSPQAQSYVTKVSLPQDEREVTRFLDTKLL